MLGTLSSRVACFRKGKALHAALLPLRCGERRLTRSVIRSSSGAAAAAKRFQTMPPSSSVYSLSEELFVAAALHREWSGVEEKRRGDVERSAAPIATKFDGYVSRCKLNAHATSSVRIAVVIENNETRVFGRTGTSGSSFSLRRQ